MDIAGITNTLLGAGPFGIMSAVALFLYWNERNRNQQIVDKLIDLSTNTTATLRDITTAVNAAIRARTGGDR